MQRPLQEGSVKSKPRIPDGVTVYAVGDVHGRADLLKETFTLIDEDILLTKPDRAIQVFLGDYIDRGPASRETIDLLIDRQRDSDTVLLRGNHEAMLLQILDGFTTVPNLQSFGMLPTLRSYGLSCSLNPGRVEQEQLIEELKRIFPREHREFLQGLHPSFTCGDFFFVHAGVRPGIALDAQDENDLMWIREDFLDFAGDFGKYVVHGHTPVPTLDNRPNRMNIDTGAYATNNLTAVRIRGAAIALAHR